MDKRQVNPWTWQDRAGFSQAWRVDGPQSIVFVSGQVAVSADGGPVGEDDFEAQVRQVFDNLQIVLGEAGASLKDIVKLTVFLTDIGNLREYTRIKGEFITGQQPASTAVEVSSLALPGFMIEVEAIAAV